jgi:hypothetical protein
MRGALCAGRVAVAAKAQFHDPSYLKLNRALFRNFDPFQRFWVLGDPSLAKLALKDSEVSEFQAVTLAQLVHDIVQEELNNPFDDNALVPCSVGDSINQVLLGDRVHDGSP